MIARSTKTGQSKARRWNAGRRSSQGSDFSLQAAWPLQRCGRTSFRGVGFGGCRELPPREWPVQTGLDNQASLATAASILSADSTSDRGRRPEASRLGTSQVRVTQGPAHQRSRSSSDRIAPGPRLGGRATGFFSEQAQREVIADRFPLLMLNGRHVGEAVVKEAALRGESVSDYIRAVDVDYDHRALEPFARKS